MFLSAVYITPLFFPFAGEKRAVVVKPRACTLCRQCVMRSTGDQVETGDEVETGDQVEPTGDQVELRRVRDHFICK